MHLSIRLQATDLEDYIALSYKNWSQRQATVTDDITELTLRWLQNTTFILNYQFIRAPVKTDIGEGFEI